MRVITSDEMESLLWSIYRKGVIHGGFIAVATATVCFVWR